VEIKRIEISRFAKNVYWCDVEYDNKKFHFDLIIFDDCEDWLKEVQWAPIEAKFLKLDFYFSDFPIKEIYRLKFHTEFEDKLDIYLLRECRIEAETTRKRLDAVYKHDKKVKPEDWEDEINGYLLVEGKRERYKIPFNPTLEKYRIPANIFNIITEDMAILLVKKALEDNSNWREYSPLDFNLFTSYKPFSEKLPIPKMPRYEVIYLSPYFKELIYNKKEV
jgi:hypothetical protein